MLVFRIVCAILMAWAVNWALSRPEGEQILSVLPEMRTLGPIAAAAVGYFNLAVRQGWGFIVAFANGIWAGVLSVILSGVLYVIVALIQRARSNQLRDFDSFMLQFGEIVGPLIDQVVYVPLLIVSFGATAIVG
ncbi:MAG: hypothetical protein AAGJ28_07215, partial [Pseudomonadota bacterium]